MDPGKEASGAAEHPHNIQAVQSSSLNRIENLPRDYNTGKDIEGLVTLIGINKTTNPLSKEIFLGFLAGIWVVFAGMFTLMTAGGIPADVRQTYPAIPKLLTAVTFPVGLVFIQLFGGNLFTGNTMIMVVTVLNRKVTWKHLAVNWVSSFLTNLGTILLMTYLFGYLTELCAAEPFLSYIVGIANKKAQMSFAKCLLLGIPANALVSLAFFLGLAARDVTGKILGIYLSIATFSATGWEHCVANMFLISLGGFYGAEHVNVGSFSANIFSVALGNIIGGGILIGGSEYFLYHWHRTSEPTVHYNRHKSFKTAPESKKELLPLHVEEQYMPHRKPSGAWPFGHENTHKE